MTAYNILVIILSSFLALFLILSIVLVISLIKLVKYLRQISQKAENVVEDVEAVGDFFRKASGPMALAKLIGSVVENFGNYKRKGKK